MLDRQIDRAIDPTAARGIGYEPTYSGVPSLFRRPFSTTPGSADIAVLGVPLDLATTNFVGTDLVEVAPPYDHAEITALAGASLLLDYFCLRAKHKNSV